MKLHRILVVDESCMISPLLNWCKSSTTAQRSILVDWCELTHVREGLELENRRALLYCYATGTTPTIDNKQWQASLVSRGEVTRSCDTSSRTSSADASQANKVTVIGLDADNYQYTMQPVGCTVRSLGLDQQYHKPCLR